MFLSSNNGSSWTAVNTGLPASSSVYALAISGTNIFAGTQSDGVFLSINNGNSWTAVNTGITNTNVKSIAISGTNIFAGTYGGGIFLSTNNGSSWTAVNTGVTNLDVISFAISGTNTFTGTNGDGVFLSTNYGGLWTGGSPANTYVNSIAISGTSIFAGTDVGVFLSSNNGSSWSTVNTGLINMNITSIAISGTNIFAGTFGAGVWIRPLSELSGIEESSIAYASFKLYPNPSSGTFTIETKEKEYTIIITNVLGERIFSQKIYNEKSEIDLSKRLNGIYFLQLKTDASTPLSRTTTQKLIIQK